eukprot:s1072_g2.t1
MEFPFASLCPGLHAISSLTALPLELPSELFAALVERSLQVLFIALPSEDAEPSRTASTRSTSGDGKLALQGSDSSRSEAGWRVASS